MKLEDLKNKEFKITSEGLLKVVEKKTGKFIPNEDERYWFVNEYGEIDHAVYSDIEMLQWTINHHPVFKTEEEAEEYKDYLELLDKYKYEFSDEDWENEYIKKWLLQYFAYSGELSGGCTYNSKLPNCTYFKTQEYADAFIKEAGEENVKRFMFDVWE